MKCHGGTVSNEENTPIACTLTDSEAKVRVHEWIELQAQIRSTEPIENGTRLAFAADDELEAGVRKLAAAEGQCCAFLKLDVTTDADGFYLDITGPPGAAQEVIANLAGMK